MNKYLMIGPPASGKGTIGEMLSQELKIPFVSTGQVLRKLSHNSPFFEEINHAMATGALAPNEEVASILKSELSGEKYSNGFILDGWGRQRSDLEFFDPGFDKVILLDISPETTIKRISGRRVCEADGKNYNIYTMTAEEIQACPGVLTQRADDKEEVVQRRLQVHEVQTIPVINYFREKGNLVTVNGEQSPQEVFAEVLSKIGK